MSMAYRLILHVKEMAGSEGDISIIVRRMQGSIFLTTIIQHSIKWTIIPFSRILSFQSIFSHQSGMRSFRCL
jgi:hypothetical protein